MNYQKNRDKNVLEYFKQVIIQIHGGGFICLESGDHLNYLSTISYKLNKPIFCLDYQLSPQQKYNETMNEVYYFYLFVQSFIE